MEKLASWGHFVFSLIAAVFSFGISVNWKVLVVFVMQSQDKDTSHGRSTEQIHSLAYQLTENQQLINLQPQNLINLQPQKLINLETHQLTNSKTYQPTNLSTHQLTNLSPHQLRNSKLKKHKT